MAPLSSDVELANTDLQGQRAHIEQEVMRMRASFLTRPWSLDGQFLRVAGAIVVLAGLWQIVVPFLLNFADSRLAMGNAVISGILIVLFAGISLYGTARWSTRLTRASNWLLALTGVWLIISPWVLGYQELGPAFWSAIVVGLVTFVLGGYSATRGSETV
jgi:hypothetical protein